MSIDKGTATATQPEGSFHATPPNGAEWLLEIDRLRVAYTGGDEPVEILRGVDLRIAPGQRVGIVGESGSGKSMTASATIGLLAPGLERTGGRIVLEGRDISNASEQTLRDLRGRTVSIVYQNAVTSLNPVIPVGEQIARVARAHGDLSKKEARDRAVEMLQALGIPEPARKARDYPHQFSGGMAQRAAIAMALVCTPRLVIADEPTTGLDATIQVQVLEVIERSATEIGAAVLLISHELDVIRAMCDVVAVMYAGVVLELGLRDDVMRRPLSPYTQGLLACFEPEDGEIQYIAGRVPEPGTIGDSCPFADRCPRADDLCRARAPVFRERDPGHWVACHYA